MSQSQDSDVTTLEGTQSDISEEELDSPSVLCPGGRSDDTNAPAPSTLSAPTTTITVQNTHLDLGSLSNQQLKIIGSLSKCCPNNAHILRKEAMEVEAHLQVISEANQKERKRLSEVHVALCKGYQPPGGVTEERLREQVLALASRQKLLLQCVVRQKRITSEVALLSGKPEGEGMEGTQRPGEMCLTDVVGPAPIKTCTPGPLPSGPNLEHLVNSTLVPLAKAIAEAKTAVNIDQLLPSLHDTIQPPLCKGLPLPPHQRPSPPSYPLLPPLPHPPLLPPSYPLPIPSSNQPHPPPIPPSNQQHPQPIPPSNQQHPQPIPPSDQPHPPSIPPSNQPHPQPILPSHPPPPPSSHPLPSNQPPAQPSQLSEPVPLDSLVKSGLLVPNEGDIICNLLGCEFKASLLRDGRLKTQPDGKTFQTPHQWVTSCWAILGHEKRCNKKQAYKAVHYKGLPLSYYCEQYCMRKVSTYLSQKGTLDPKQTSQQIDSNASVAVKSVPSTSTTNPLPPIEILLASGWETEVVLFGDPSSTSLKLPANFWGTSDVNLFPHMLSELEEELLW